MVLSRFGLYILSLHTVILALLHAGSPVVAGGLENLKLMKTTQSGFVGENVVIRTHYTAISIGFVQDEFTTLPEVTDRALCTNIYSKYWYNSKQILKVDYAKVRYRSGRAGY